MASTIQVDKIQDTGGNTILSSNSTGTFTYEAASGANFTALDADNISAGTLATGRMAAGTVVQVVSTSKTDTFSESIAANGVGSDITGMSVAITPTAASSKILILANISMGRDNMDGSSAVGVQLVRGTTLIGVGDTASNRTRVSSQCNLIASKQLETISIMFLDSPSSTSETTYHFRFFNSDGDISTIYLNRSDNDSDSASRGRGASSATAMEYLA
jgi:hypothetical protein